MKFKSILMTTLAFSISLTSSGAEARTLRRRMIGDLASWYGPGFWGHRTASGEPLNRYAFTAAHRFLPFGTRLRVTDQRTGRSVVVRINDRGPFAPGRVIDLSYASARAIGMAGTDRVSLALR